MLYDLIIANHDEIVARSRVRVAVRRAPSSTDAELKHGVPLLLRQLATRLKDVSSHSRDEVRKTAIEHGRELLATGFTVGQVVHDYGDLCQVITELAAELGVSIAVAEFRVLNMCLDDAIAHAVTAYGELRERTIMERSAALAHELRNALNAALLSFNLIREGKIAAGGSTGAVLLRSLHTMRDLIDRSLVEVRLGQPLRARTLVDVAVLMEEVEIAAQLDASSRGLAFAVSWLPVGVCVFADRQLLASALANLLQNALKFSRPGGSVFFRGRVVGTRVYLEVEDECGGLPPGKAETLFLPFEQRGLDRTGLGLGLTISREAVLAADGTIEVRNLPGKGCIFIVDLPLAPAT